MTRFHFLVGLLILLLNSCCKPEPKTAQNETFPNRLQGRISYHGQFNSPVNDDWCGSHFNSDVQMNDQHQLENIVVLLGGGSINLFDGSSIYQSPQADKTVPAQDMVTITDCRIQPSTIVIRENGQLTIQNMDSQNLHTLYLVHNKAVIGQTTLQPGTTEVISIPEDGLYLLGEFRNNRWLAIHIYVTTMPLFTRSDHNGYFYFDDLAAGNYQLHLLHPVLGEIMERITLDPEENELLKFYF